jgi:UDP-N-acetylmuramate dehydrogenase
MRLGGTARYAADVKNVNDVQEAWSWAQSRGLQVIMVGRGSNIIWRDEGFGGLLLVNKIPGLRVISEDAHAAMVMIGAGENWDKAVEWTVNKKLSGIEFMSLVPGTAGAAPVQNVGAYGGELSSCLVELEAFDTNFSAIVKLQNHECNFSYRSSRFKSSDRGRFFITSITLNLKKISTAPPGDISGYQRLAGPNGASQSICRLAGRKSRL